MRIPRRRFETLLGILALMVSAGIPGPAPAANQGPSTSEIPSWLPRYDLNIDLQLDRHLARVQQRVTWTNRHARPTSELVFNAHSHYKIPDDQIGFLAKMVEIMRMAPGDALDLEGQACDVERVRFLNPSGQAGHATTTAAIEVPFHFQKDNPTALVVSLPGPVAQGQTVTIEIEFTMRLPQKQGRWGQWDGITFLSNWNPVLAFYDDHGWQPTPFIPWHQPFFNEAGIYTVHALLPADQKIACSVPVLGVKDLGNGMQQVDFQAAPLRDFALLCSARFCEYTGQAGPVLVRCLALPEHEYYAREMVRIASEAIPVYSQWFGPYPYPQFTIAESYFGWNGNECAGLVMIDARVFGMPHMAGAYVDYLVSHETCHQWWYNVVGTNGYAETWMDEGLATYFSHRLMDLKHGRNNRILDFPRGLEWLPNIPRETYRYYGLYGTLARGENCAIVEEMPRFKHIVTLFSMCYDKGSKVVGMIENRLGTAAFFDFMHGIYARYHFRIIRVADFQRELEEYTGQSWDEFFKQWLYGPGVTDWSIAKVKIKPVSAARAWGHSPLANGEGPRGQGQGPAYQVTVLLRQKEEYSAETVLGFCLDGSDSYQIRIPIQPQAGLVELDDPPARIEARPDNCVQVEITLPCKPTQIAVDPDQVLIDREPTNNYWKARIRWRLAPLYTQLEETDLTTAYDRWNVTVGPWLYGAAYADPWFTRSTMAGLRAGVYRTQELSGGTYLAYRTDDRNVVVGADALLDHWPWSHTQLGLNVERSIASFGDDRPNSRGVLFGRYVFQYGDSLYLPPMHYVELFADAQENALPLPRETVPGADHFDQANAGGIHYHLDYRTPYWDPEGGFLLDMTYDNGIPIFGEHAPFYRLRGQFAFVKGLPDGLGWFSETRLAARIYGAAGLPDNGQYFTLGGGDLFRGFDLQQRQGNIVWVGNVEWRLPLVQHVAWDCCDHLAGVRNAYAAAFYDVGEAYLLGHSLGGVAHALGCGLRLDVAWFSFVERTTLRFDAAKTINASTPWQFWFGVQQPF